MKDKAEILEDFKHEIDGFLHQESPEFDEDNPSVPLVSCPYGSEEVGEALESMLSTYVTMGEKVEEFEDRWTEVTGSEHGVMANSGSSANLLAMKALETDLDEGSEVIVPAVGWSTTYFPVIDAGAKPVYVDVDPEELKIDTGAIRSAISDETEALMLVHLLGNPAQMDEIVEICEEHDLVLVEDCAEAHGAEFDGEKVGGFGDIGTFSFSFSHHITTMEGGIAVTDTDKYFERMKQLRSWGRSQDPEDSSDLDFAFVSHGYNLRPTEIQAAFGKHQIDKLEGFVEERRKNARYMNERLRDVEGVSILEESGDSRCSYLHYPLILEESISRSKKELIAYLEENGIEARPLLSGNITRHPAFQQGPGRVEGDLTGADRVHEKGVYVSCHPYLSRDHMDYVVEKIKEFV